MAKSTLESNLKCICRSEVFKNCDIGLLTEVLKSFSKSVTFQKGDIIVAPQSAAQLCVIIKGEARVSKGETVISRLKPCDIFGAAYVYNKSNQFENEVVAVTALKAVFISREGLDRLIAEDRNFAFSYIEYLSGRVSFLNGKIAGYIRKTAEEKLITFLEKSCVCDDDGGRVIDLSMTELSAAAGISRASLYRVLDGMEKQNKIRRCGKKIYLTS